MSQRGGGKEKDTVGEDRQIQGRGRDKGREKVGRRQRQGEKQNRE